MRNIILLSALVLSMTFATESFAQSGSRGSSGGGARSSSGGGSRSSGGGARSSSGGSRAGFGRSRSNVRQPTPAELEFLARQQQQEAERLAKLQDEFVREQFKQTLVQLALRENRSANSRQYRSAFREAEQDYKKLRTGKIAPDQVGALQVPFRLSEKDIDRSEGTVQWPEALQAEQYSELTETLNATIEGGVTSAEAAEQLFGELKTLNTAVNQAAADREINSSEYAMARRFVTGLANEVRATDHADAVLVGM